jgi:sulfhydrogenase subunit gamma (sulfur reductase)
MRCGVNRRDGSGLQLGLGFTKDRVYTTLENRIKCGVGKCGRCNVGSLYVCKDGPVFTTAQIERMPDDM